MQNPDWALLLQMAYQSGHGTVQWPERLDEDDPERERNNPNDLREVDLTREEVERALQFVERTGLMSQVANGKHYELTEKGFNVANERELRKRQYRLTEAQNDANDTLANFTIILGATALVQALAAVISAPRYSVSLSVIYLLLLGILWYKGEDWFHHR